MTGFFEDPGKDGDYTRIQPDLTAARIERDEAIERVVNNTDDEWREAAWTVMVDLCRYRTEFSAWDHTQQMERDFPGVEPHDLRSLGGPFMAAVRAGMIEDSGQWVRHPKRHATKITLWRVVSGT